MIDLEKEFAKLKQEALDRVRELEETGELTESDADALANIVNIRMGINNAPEEERCPDGHGPGCGWSSSMGYHCW